MKTIYLIRATTGYWDDRYEYSIKAYNSEAKANEVKKKLEEERDAFLKLLGEIWNRLAFEESYDGEAFDKEIEKAREILTIDSNDFTYDRDTPIYFIEEIYLDEE